MIVLTLARKPLIGSVATNALKHGVGGINIDGCRLACLGEVVEQDGRFQTLPRETIHPGYDRPGRTMFRTDKPVTRQGPANCNGRWPANLILCHLPGCHCQGTTRVPSKQSTSVGSGKGFATTEGHGIYSYKMGGVVRSSTADADGMETVASWDCLSGCPVAWLDQQSGDRPVSGSARLGAASKYNPKGSPGSEMLLKGISGGNPAAWPNDSGGASRFFKQVGGVKQS